MLLPAPPLHCSLQEAVIKKCNEAQQEAIMEVQEVLTLRMLG